MHYNYFFILIVLLIIITETACTYYQFTSEL